MSKDQNQQDKKAEEQEQEDRGPGGGGGESGSGDELGSLDLIGGDGFSLWCRYVWFPD